MADLVAPVVLLPALLLAAAFVGLWRYRFAELPPVRATAAVAAAALVVVYSLLALSEFTEDPLQSVATLLAAVALLALAQYVWVRARG